MNFIFVYRFAGTDIIVHQMQGNILIKLLSFISKGGASMDWLDSMNRVMD